MKKDHSARKQAEPYFKALIKNKKGTIQLPQIANATGKSYGVIVQYFSEYMRDRNIGMPRPEPVINGILTEAIPIKIKAVFMMPDGSYQVYGSDNRLMKELSGKSDGQLLSAIKERTDEDTRWSGFDENNHKNT